MTSSNSSKSSVIKKTNVLGISKLPENVDICKVSSACASFIKTVKGIRLSKSRDSGLKNAFIDFISTKQCEAAKDIGKVTIDGKEYPLNYARAGQPQPFNISASEDKLYVKFPSDIDEKDIIKLLGDVKISKPENSTNFLFAICKDIEQQCQLIKTLDNKPIGGGLLSVKVAIDKTRKKRYPSRSSSFNKEN